MDIQISSRGQNLTVQLRKFIEEKAESLDKFIEASEKISFLLDWTDSLLIVEVTVMDQDSSHHKREMGDNPYACVDKAVSKLKEQLRKKYTNRNRTTKESSCTH